MANNVFYGFVGEHKTGRYSKAHAHMSAAILVCLKGKGYTYTWPRSEGMTPWKDGKTKNIYRQDYEPVGLVTAAPYGGDWFHAHFGISKEPLRLIGWYGPNNHRKDKAGVPGEKDTDEGAIDVTEGGTAIPYWLEDPLLRKEYEETLAREGVKSEMGDELYRARRGAARASQRMIGPRRASGQEGLRPLAWAKMRWVQCTTIVVASMPSCCTRPNNSVALAGRRRTQPWETGRPRYALS